MLAALALTLLAQCSPTGPIYSCPSLMTNYANFEVAPSNGAGMGVACACTSPTEVHGGVPSFARASNAYCAKGSETSGIANGDFVECASGQPRVQPGGDGTGPLGLGISATGTNLNLRSDQFDNAAWANFIAGAGTNPTKGGADTDTAPDNTLTAEKVTFNITGAADSSALSQTVLSAVAESGSIFARGNATTASGTIDLCLDTAAAQSCVAVPYVLGSWTRTCLPNITSKASGKFYLGNLSSLNGGTARAAQTVTLWVGQAEAGSVCSPPIKTAGTTVTRLDEVANFPYIPLTATTGSMSVTVVFPSATAADATGDKGFLAQSVGAAQKQIIYPSTATVVENFIGGTKASKVFVGSGVHRFATWWSASATGVLYDGVEATGTAATTTIPDNLEIGTFGHLTGKVKSGTYKLICSDTSSTRCR